MSLPALRAPPPIRQIGPDPGPGHHTGGIGALWQHRRLVWTFVVNDLKQKYTGSTIGFFWTVITPLLELATYTFVFHFVLGLRDGYGDGRAEWASYAIFLFCGMVTWSGIQEGIIRATTSISDHGHLIKKVNFHAITLPGYVVASAMLNQVIRLGVLLSFIVAANPAGLTWHLGLVPPVLVLQGAFVLGIGMLLATIATYFKDTVHVVKAVMLLLMFVTPVFYGPEAYPPRLDLIKQLNPMSHMVGVYRQLLINQEVPDSRTFIIIAVIASFSLLAGYSVFHHHQDRFADHV